MPPGLLRLGVAAVGTLALAVGFVAVVNGTSAGIAIAVGGAALLAWSVYGQKLRP